MYSKSTENKGTSQSTWASEHIQHSGYDWTNVGALTSITVLLSPATDAWYFGNAVCQVNGGAQMTFTYNAWNKVTPSVTILGTVA